MTPRHLFIKCFRPRGFYAAGRGEVFLDSSWLLWYYTKTINSIGRSIFGEVSQENISEQKCLVGFVDQ